MTTKVCSKCNRELPETTEFFHQRTRRGKTEFFAICKQCRRESRLSDSPEALHRRQQIELGTQGLRRCVDCGEIKPLDGFYKKAGREQQYLSVCVPCHNRNSTEAQRQAAALRPKPIREPNKQELQVIQRAVRHQFAYAILSNRRIRKHFRRSDSRIASYVPQHNRILRGSDKERALTEKTCTRCGSTLPLTAEFWQRDKHGLGGFMSICKACRNAVKKAYAQANPAAVKEQKRRSHIRNREKNLKRARDWQEANWEVAYDRIKAHGRKRRALALGSGGTHTPQQLADMLIAQDGKCYYCGADISQHRHVDHYIPLTRGGSNDISNIVLACATCNLSKGNKLPSEWTPD